MKLLIIGSKGFIGSHVFKYFKNVGHNVFGCDIEIDHSTEKYFKIDSENLDYNYIFRNETFDVCINCSGAASVSNSFIYPIEDFVANTLIVAKHLEAIRRNSPNCKYINISSAAIYGNPVELPMNENHSRAPISPYGVHKLMSEMICNEYSLFFKVPVIIVRVFSVYGTGLKKQLFWDIYKKLLDSDEIELFGTGMEIRDFIHVEDFVRALPIIIENANFNGSSINIGSGVGLELRYLTNVISDIYKSEFKRNIKIKFSARTRNGDPDILCADTKEMIKLGCKSRVEIEEGLKEFYLWAME